MTFANLHDNSEIFKGRQADQPAYNPGCETKKQKIIYDILSLVPFQMAVPEEDDIDHIKVVDKVDRRNMQYALPLCILHSY